MSQGDMPTQSNLKKVLRTALVGIKPADQVMIKGYLRVLLRLEADLEWVSANHSQVDLFMINNEFRSAASITKLLSSQSKKPVLYVSRTDIDEGWITQDRLILPLKKLDGLNEWLMTSVMALKQGAGTVTTILQQNEAKRSELNRSNHPIASNNSNIPNTPKNSATTLAHTTATTESPSINSGQINGDSIKSNSIKSNSIKSNLVESGSITSRPINRLETQANHKSNHHNIAANKSSQSDHNANQPTINYAELIDTIKQLNAKLEGHYQIMAKGESSAIAIIAPKEGRVWCQEGLGTQAALSDWQLTPYQGAALDPSDAYDLTQWLWQQAWEHSEGLLALASDSARYQLGGWVKPELRDYSPKLAESIAKSLAKKERQQLLFVMTAIESKPKTINDLASAAQISVKSVKKIIVSLLFSGSLHQTSYEYLDSRVINGNNSVNDGINNNVNTSTQAATDLALTATVTAEAPTASLAQNLQNDASQSDSAESDPKVSTPTAPPEVSDDLASAQQQKMGFLSRLRKKLGL